MFVVKYNCDNYAHIYVLIYNSYLSVIVVCLFYTNWHFPKCILGGMSVFNM